MSVLVVQDKAQGENLPKSVDSTDEYKRTQGLCSQQSEMSPILWKFFFKKDFVLKVISMFEELWYCSAAWRIPRMQLVMNTNGD